MIRKKNEIILWKNGYFYNNKMLVFNKLINYLTNYLPITPKKVLYHYYRIIKIDNKG